MKKIILSAILFAAAVAGYAQRPDKLEIGPYEVEYFGEGDYKARLRKGIDLYKYFDLKRDTVIKKNVIMPNPKSESNPVKCGIQASVFMSLPRFAVSGNSNMFGVSGSWKQQFGKKYYWNAGLSLGYLYGEYSSPSYREDAMIEVGIPLSVEFACLDYKKSSVYAGIGLTPTFYSTLKADEIDENGATVNGEKDSGFLIAPRVDFGGYIPLSKHILRVGIFAEYKINCSGDVNIYKERIGRAFVGANVGIIF
ncbi:MAG: hypothetical protein IJ328_01060 [Muribaculaceae bacterium]|nr:hypothetical protein [Muribaculaceae bacterium]